MERKINYNSGKFITSIPLEIAKMLKLSKGDYLRYEVLEDGTVTIKKVEESNKHD